MSDLDPPTREAQAQAQTQEEEEGEEEEWERRARTWLTTLPRRRNVTTDEMDVWIDSNLSSIPHQIISNPRSHLYGRIISLHKLIRRANQASDVAEGELPKRPFQRTEQWIPVYSWLESLDANEVVKSKAINEWLSQNPKVKEQLFATHSSYQLMHYIRKCHARILRKRGKLQKAIPATKPPTTITPINDHNAGPIPVAVLPPTITPVKDLNTAVLPVAVLPTTIAPVKDLSTQVLPVAVPLNTGSLSCNVPNDNDFSLSKKNEAFVRYEILTDLESQLTSILSKHRQIQPACGFFEWVDGEMELVPKLLDKIDVLERELKSACRRERCYLRVLLGTWVGILFVLFICYLLISWTPVDVLELR